MKYAILLLLLPLMVMAQENNPGIVRGQVQAGTTVVYSKSNYTTSTADTTAYMDISKNGEIGYIIVSNDSCGVDVYFDGKNSLVAGATTTYADSLVTTSNTGSNTSVVVKSTTVNRLPNEDLVRFRVICRGSGQGTTSGRTLKIYKFYKTP